MALETVTHINDLVVTNPTSTDPASQGDDHIRNIKRAIKTTFPNITGPVTLTQAEINALTGRATTLENRNITAGSGISGGGNLTADRTIAVDSTVIRTTGNQTLGGVKTFSSIPVLPASNPTADNEATRKAYVDAQRDTRVPNTRTLTGGDGITTTIGDLSVDRTISVDASVVRTSGAQNIGGHKTLTDSNFSQQNGGTTHFWMRNADGTPRALIYKGNAANDFRLRSYSADGLTYQEVLINGTTGAVSAPSFSGVGTALTALNASNLGSGTVPDARLSGNYSGLGSLTATSFLGNASDTVTTPAHSWASDTNTGMYRVSDTEIGFTINGVKAAGINSGGVIGHVKDARTITAGNGLSGGGSLAADRTITLGTPGSITSTSTNSVTATSHTHAITEATIRTLISEGNVGALGTYALLYNPSNTRFVHGDTTAGSGLRYSSANGTGETNAPSGTWQCMGKNETSSNWPYRVTLWLRIA